VGFADPELALVFGEAEGLAPADDAELPDAVVAVTVCVLVVVVSAVGASADRT
jgi:hypothetical protein